ncbi:MAG: biopolymer transporter ExbD [candidate division KSB1 bacterium]|nr:biopolymer transporter ExbD [candidate division KSB1 bacterium]MDZ7274647.1 biopolymer transporter ExbD [candidate division KSB1 bacterium]MDZ7285472.1 biopolymer transporter ExbD [candidate division KSB1 bacterium]MDZ7298504.1 biopolymer transporter ExbD [candidate division KSB1 bacterium]MDZ7306272.1 biopolymer transporter ExbD [candidate division KSB1 bacterium]
MGKGGMIIRYIDIALTVLFGFIAISDIEQKTQVRLPRSVSAVSTPTAINTVTLAVLPGPVYTLLEGPTELIRDAELERVEQELLTVRQKYLERQQDIIVLIQPDPNSPVQLTVNVLDVCERNQIQRNINYVEPGV